MNITYNIVESLEPLLAKIQDGENAKVEFKQEISNKYKIAKTIASFANSNGGSLFIGISDDKELIGIDVEQELFLLQQAADFVCTPPVKLECILYENAEIELQILEVIIPNSILKPHYINDMHGKRKLYIRQQDKSIAASNDMAKLLNTNISNIKSDKKEEAFLELLQIHKKMTVKEFSRRLNIGEQRAKRFVVNLLVNGYIIKYDDEKSDYYTLK
jgi:predicted HTH transcriptional regulator